MEKFEIVDALVAPLDRPNVDTDAIIPKQFLKSIKRSGFGPNLFDEWRYLGSGEPGMDNTQRTQNPDFVLNKSRYQGAGILLARENFGCGSSREQAATALKFFGIRLVLAVIVAILYFTGKISGVVAIVLGIIAVAFFITSLAGYCPAYTPLGIKTCKGDK